MAGEGKVIKPPIENVASGKIIKPSKKFRNKMWFTAIFSAVALWIILFGTLWLVLFLVNPAGQIWSTWWTIINLWYIAIALVFLVPYCIIIPYYLRSIEYSVITEEGTTAREIFVKKGIINITRKKFIYTVTGKQYCVASVHRLSR